MIQQITIKNFKLFQNETTFPTLKKVNILTGVNGRGKSSFLQSLLLPAQSVLSNIHTRDIVLNGDYVQLGTSRSLRNEANDFDTDIVFKYDTGGEVLEYTMGQQGVGAQMLSLKNLRYLKIDGGEIITDINSDINQEFFNLQFPNENLQSLKFDHIQYISADRIGPRNSYDVSNHGNVGARGEYAPSVLYFNKDNMMGEAYIDFMLELFPSMDEEISYVLSDQVEFWLSKMYGRTRIETQYIEEVNKVCLKFMTTGHAVFNNSTNVGFGYTYALPIIIAGLAAKPDDILVIENPEAHLHPSAQSILGRFLAAIAANGVQIFVETHSEHILNAFRVLIVQRVVEASDVNVMFFDEAYESKFEQIEILNNGKIKSWPDKFFDQSEKDLRLIVGL